MTCSQANPCRSIAQAAATAQANKTVWLMNGDYTGVTQPAPIAIPAGLTLRALTPGLAGVGQQIVLQGNGTNDDCQPVVAQGKIVFPGRGYIAEDRIGCVASTRVTVMAKKL